MSALARMLAGAVSQTDVQLTEWKRWACGKLCDCTALIAAGPQWSALPIDPDVHADGCRYKIVHEELST